MKSAIVAVLLIGIFTGLLVTHFIASAAYVTLIAIALLVAAAIAWSPRLKELDFKNLKLELQELKETKAELYAREEDLKRISYMLMMVLSFSTTTQDRMGSAESHKLQSMWFQKRLAELANSFHFSDIERQELSKYVDKYNEFDSVMGKVGSLQTTDPDYKEKKQKLTQISGEIEDMLRADLEEPS